MSEVADRTTLAGVPSDLKVQTVVNTSDLEDGTKPQRSWWNKSSRTKEKKLLLKLDLFILSWACFGYFLRLLDSSNLTNAYVSGMQEDLELYDDQYNYFQTLWTIGYTVGMIPSQVIVTHVRPSLWLPLAEVTWAILTFCFAAVKNYKHIYALRLLLGLAESPFYVGAMTLLGSWYTPKELATRATIFYSASFAAQMFSGYLQAAVYTGLDGVHRLPGWRWLFLICGVINIPGAIWGFFAVPDSPYDTKAFYLDEEERALAKSRVVEVGRKPFDGVNLQTFKSVLSRPFVWVFVVNYIFYCLDTYGMGFFAIYLKALGEYTVQEVNVLQNRTSVALVVTALNFVTAVVLTTVPSKAGAFFGYLVNPATLAYGPLMISFLGETFTSLADERALILGFAQAFGATFNAWVPLLIFNTGSQAPYFRTGWITSSVCAVLQGFGILLLAHFSKKIRKETVEVEY
ncbi:major facilitator superfamily transporter [Dactylonectria macrodidyma]|uniref:Major facilitator superfamily transporter n=1 Tax=Dactylonectria macrodidyma TaxID=307937 RepID=A0A9P9E1L5_9HYPO|nr:major facilitator superfamily transporter [Dactylonectria macrodidyma]